MSNILNEEIKKNLYGIVQENIDDYEYFHFGEFVEKPNQCGCFERNGNWYTYVILSLIHIYSEEIYNIVKNSPESWAVEGYDLITSHNAK